MPNLTIHLTDEVYSFARIYAARNRTSASALIADYLITLRKVTRKTRKRLHPHEIAAMHCDLLKESEGRVNPDARTIWDYSAIVNAILELREAVQNEIDSE